MSARKNRFVHFVKLCVNFPVVNRGRIRSVCIVLDCKVGCCGFDSGTGPILKVLILLINVHVGTCTCTLFALQTARPLPAGLDDH